MLDIVGQHVMPHGAIPGDNQIAPQTVAGWATPKIPATVGALVPEVAVARSGPVAIKVGGTWLNGLNAARPPRGQDIAARCATVRTKSVKTAGVAHECKKPRPVLLRMHARRISVRAI